MTKSLALISPLVGVLLLGSCSQQERERMGSIPAQSTIKAEQVEAQQLLQQAFALQAAFYSANGQYGTSLTEIGVKIPTNARYQYELSSTGSTWHCEATANLDTDPTVDTWTVDQDGGVHCMLDDAIS